MFLPLSSMVLIMVFMLIYTGYDAQKSTNFFDIISNSSGSTSVLYSVIFSIIIASFYYVFKGILSAKEIIKFGANRVVYLKTDPDNRTNGKGKFLMEEAGIECFEAKIYENENSDILKGKSL